MIFFYILPNIKMSSSYFDRLQRFRRNLDSSQDFMPDAGSVVQNLDPVGADQSQNIFKDKQAELRDKIAEDALGPFAGLGGVDVIRRGIKAIPEVKKLRAAMKTGSDLYNKVTDVLGSDAVKDLVDDPAKALRTLAQEKGEDFVNKLTDTLNEGVRSFAQGATGGESGDLGDIATQLGEKARAAVGEIGSQATEAARTAASNIAQNLGVTGQAPEVDPELQANFNELFAQQEAEQGPAAVDQQAGERPARAGAGVEPGEEEEFFDAHGEGQVSDVDNLRNTLNEAMGRGQEILEGYKARQPLREGLPEAEPSGVGENIPSEGVQEAQKISSDTAQKVSDLQKTLAGADAPSSDPSTLIAEQTKDADQLATQAASDLKDAGSMGAELAGGAMTDAADEAVAGLGVGDVVPVVGDLAAIGGIIGTAVDYYNNKAKEEKAAAAEKARSQALQHNIAVEQSEIAASASAQARSAQQEAQAALQAKQAAPAQQVPFSEAGFEPQRN